MKYLMAIVILLAGCGENDAFVAKSMALSPVQKQAVADNIQPFHRVNTTEGFLVSDPIEMLPGYRKYAACAACHGQQGGGGIGPALAGKGIDYISDRLIAYRAGETVGSQSNMMWAQAGGLTDMDINELAEYLDTL